MRRRILRILLILVGLVAGAFVFLLLRYPPDTWKDRALAELRARTGIEATAESASLSFPWPLGLKLAGVALQDTTAGKPYRRLTATMDHVVVSAEPLSLVRGTPHLSEIRVARPVVELWTQEAEADSDERADATSGGAAAVLALVAIDDGRLTLHAPDGSRTEVRGLSQRGDLQLGAEGAWTGRLEGGIETIQLVASDGAVQELPAIRFKVQGEGTTTPPEGTLEVQTLASAGLTATGPVRFDLGGPAPLVSAEWAVEADLETVFPVVRASMPSDPWLAGTRAEGRATGRLTVSGHVPGEGASPEDWLSMVAAQGALDGIRLEVMGEEVRIESGTWSLGEGSFRAESDAVRWPGTEAKVRLEAPANGEGRMDLDLELTTELEPTVALARRAWPRLPAEVTAESEGPETWPAMTGSTRGTLTFDITLPRDPDATDPLDGIHVGGEMTLDGITIRDRGWSEPVRLVSGTAKPATRQIDVYQVRVEGPGFVGSVNGAVGGWPERQDITFVARMETLNLDVATKALAAPPETSWRWDPVGVAWAQEPAPLWEPTEDLVLRGAVHAEELTVQEYTFTAVSSRAFLEGRKLEVPVVQGKLGDGDVQGQAAVDWTGETATWTATGTAASVPSQAFLSPVSTPLATAISTKLGGKIELAGPVLADPDLVRNNLTGDGRFNADSGSLLTEPLLGDALDAFLGAFAPRFKTVDFRSLAAGLRFEDGDVVFDEMVVRGETIVRAKGRLGLDGQRTDTVLTISLPPGVTPDLGALAPLAEYLRNPDGRLEFDVRLTGPAAQPKVAIDTSQLADRARERGGDALRSRLENLVPGASGSGTVKDVADSLARELGDKLGGEAGDLLRRWGRKKGSGGSP